MIAVAGVGVLLFGMGVVGDLDEYGWMIMLCWTALFLLCIGLPAMLLAFLFLVKPTDPPPPE